MSNVFDIGRTAAAQALKQAQKAARNAGKPHTDETTMHVEITVTFPDGGQSKYSSPVAVDGDAFQWTAFHDGTRFVINGTTGAE